MTVLVTVTLDDTRESAKARLEQAGFTVVRVSYKTPATITPRDPNMRASAVTDMPQGLSRYERAAYVKGYAKGCMAYVKKHGSPGLPGRGNDKAVLRKRAIEHEWDRHPECHRAAMKELRLWQERTVAYCQAREARLREAS